MASLASKHLSMSTSFLMCCHGGASGGTEWVRRAQWQKHQWPLCLLTDPSPWSFPGSLFTLFSHSQDEWVGGMFFPAWLPTQGNPAAAEFSSLQFPFEHYFHYATFEP